MFSWGGSSFPERRQSFLPLTPEKKAGREPPEIKKLPEEVFFFRQIHQHRVMADSMAALQALIP